MKNEQKCLKKAYYIPLGSLTSTGCLSMRRECLFSTVWYLYIGVGIFCVHPRFVTTDVYSRSLIRVNMIVLFGYDRALAPVLIKYDSISTLSRIAWLSLRF